MNFGKTSMFKVSLSLDSSLTWCFFLCLAKLAQWSWIPQSVQVTVLSEWASLGLFSFTILSFSSSSFSSWPPAKSWNYQIKTKQPPVIVEPFSKQDSFAFTAKEEEGDLWTVYDELRLIGEGGKFEGRAAVFEEMLLVASLAVKAPLLLTFWGAIAICRALSTSSATVIMCQPWAGVM